MKEISGAKIAPRSYRCSLRKPSALLDATNYVKGARDFVSQTYIKIVFVKVELMTFEPELEAGNKVDDLCRAPLQ